MTILSKTFTKRWIAPVAVAALTIAGSPLAYAGSQAYTQLEITDGFFFRADTGNALRLGVDITILSFEERGQVSANRIEGAGAGLAVDEGIDTTPNDGVLLGPTAAGAANIDQVCVGTGCGSAPDFPGDPFVQGDVNTDEYNRAALLVSGTGLNLTAASGGAINDDPNSTQLVAEAITQGSANDIAISSLANSTRFTVTFTANEDVAVGFQGDVFRAMRLLLDDDATGTAAGNINFAFSVFDITGGTIVNLTNNLPQLNLSTQTPGAAGEISFSNSMFYTTQTTTALVAGRQYQLTLNWDVRSDLNVEVPEPAPLGLLGLGLLAIPLVRRFKARG